MVGICALAENMPDGNAQRPGDIVTSMSGQTIEVINTDAEGRLVLADAMTWAQRQYKPEVMIDLATLTGAMIISLGHEYGGMFSNDDGLAESLVAAGQASGDKLWRLPMGEAYDKIMDSQIADMKNSAGARGRLDHRRLLPRPLRRGGRQMGASRHCRHGLGGQGRATSTTRARPATASPCSTATSPTITRARALRLTRPVQRFTLPRKRGREPCRSCAGALLSLILLPAPAVAQDPGMNEIIVTGSRINRRRTRGGGRPAVGLRRTADFAVMYVTIAGDTREMEPRRQEILTMVRSAIELAQRSGVELATGDFIVEPLTSTITVTCR